MLQSSITSVSPHLPQTHVGRGAFLQFSPIILNEEYRKIWSIFNDDFICITKNGKVINNNIYRIGGRNTPNLEKDNYFSVIKYLENQKGYLEGRWCIFNKNGLEKVEFAQFKIPYLVKNSCIYSIDSNYYNIETGEHYCYSSTSIESKDFLFLESRFAKDKSVGIMKIDKKTGDWELFP